MTTKNVLKNLKKLYFLNNAIYFSLSNETENTINILIDAIPSVIRKQNLERLTSYLENNNISFKLLATPDTYKLILFILHSKKDLKRYYEALYFYHLKELHSIKEKELEVSKKILDTLQHLEKIVN